MSDLDARTLPPRAQRPRPRVGADPFEVAARLYEQFNGAVVPKEAK